MKTANRILAFLLCTAVLLGLLPLTAPTAAAATYSGTCGDNLTWVLDTDTGVLTISGSGDMKDYSLSQAAPWDSKKYSIKSVQIGNSVTSIGYDAFSLCSNLTSVTLGDSVMTLNSFAFSYCGSLTSVTIPDSVTTIDTYAFSGCDSLTNVWIGNSLAIIGDMAFKSCTSLTGIWVDEENPNFSSDAYGVLFNKDKTTLVLCPDAYSGDYTIPGPVTTIGAYAFDSCLGLMSVTIPNSVTTIGEYAFNSCTSLTSVTIPDSVTTIGASAFNGCKSLTNIKIPSSVKTIGSNAFNSCSSLTSITIPDSVTTINSGVFRSCRSLTSLTLPSSVTSFGEYAFAGCGLTSITIPDSVTSIGAFAFSSSSLTSIKIPDSVTTISSNAFASCKSLTSVTIGNSVTTIGDSAFRDCSSLTSVTIPASVTTIGSYAFHSCTGLTSVTIPASVTQIKDRAFYSCTRLTSVTIPESVTYIGNYAFYYCTSLTSVTIPESVTYIGSYAFNSCNRLASVTILNPDCSFNSVNGTLGVAGTTTIYGYRGSSAQTYAEKYGYKFVPIANDDKTLKFNMNISADAEMVVNYSFMASAVSEYTDFYLEVSKNVAGGDPVVTTYGITDEHIAIDVMNDPATGKPLLYNVAYTGINAKEMGDEFATTLYAIDKNGKVYKGETVVSSIKEFMMGKLNDAKSSDELKTMAVDMLRYGEAAQHHFSYDTENLVTNELTEEHLAYATKELPEAVNYQQISGDGANVTTSIIVGSKVELSLSTIVRNLADPSAVKCVITDEDGKVLQSWLRAAWQTPCSRQNTTMSALARCAR